MSRNNLCGPLTRKPVVTGEEFSSRLTSSLLISSDLIHREGLLISGAEIATIGAEDADLTTKLVVAVGHEKFTYQQKEVGRVSKTTLYNNSSLFLTNICR